MSHQTQIRHIMSGVPEIDRFITWWWEDNRRMGKFWKHTALHNLNATNKQTPDVILTIFAPLLQNNIIRTAAIAGALPARFVVFGNCHFHLLLLLWLSGGDRLKTVITIRYVWRVSLHARCHRRQTVHLVVNDGQQAEAVEVEAIPHVAASITNNKLSLQTIQPAGVPCNTKTTERNKLRWSTVTFLNSVSNKSSAHATVQRCQIGCTWAKITEFTTCSL